MIEIVFATNNRHKIEEIQQILPSTIKILSLKDIGCNQELPETHLTIEENAIEKAMFVHQHYRVNCFAEDTGLHINALQGAPSVFSARYAGEQRNADDNMNLVLNNMKDAPNRSAYFKTVIALILDGKYYNFEGILNGTIGQEKIGVNGFGYDPIFMIADNRSLAMLTIDEKNKISHRAIATQKLINFLNNK